MVAIADSLKGRSFTRVADWSREELLEVLDLADELKRLLQAREEHHLLPGRTLGMIFQKPSTRTRVSGATRSGKRTTRLTVIEDTPASFATADSVGAEWGSLGSRVLIDKDRKESRSSMHDST